MRIARFAALTLGVLLSAGPACADDQGDARKVIDKAIKATGDEAKQVKFQAQTWKMKGTYHGMGQEIPYTGEAAMQLPDKSRMTLEFDAGGQKFTFLMVFHGDKAWTKINDQVMEMDKDRIAEQKESMYANNVSRLVTLKDKAFTLSPVGESKLDQQAVIGVRVSCKDHRDINLYFDKENGLLAKMDTRVKDEQGKEVNQETFYRDHKEAEGIKYPSKVTIKRDGMLYIEGETNDWKPAEKLDDKLFVQP
jgi:hypothetical protein